MGCGASQSDVIRSVVPKNVSEHPTNNGAGQATMNGSSKMSSSHGNGAKMDSMNASTLSNSSTIPAADFYQDSVGSGMNDYLKPLPRSLPPLKPPRGTKNLIGFTDQNTNELNLVNRNSRIEPVAFDVPVEEDSADGSLIKRHPPRRLRRTMEDQQGEPASLTQECLEEKVQLANQRRNQVLHERVASARQKSARVNRVRTTRPVPMLDSEHFVNEFGEANEKD